MQQPHRTRRLRRPCREHEREWQGRCVDRNLEDQWLERLNSLKAFDLVSICEGHVDRRNRINSAPHVNFRLKSEFFNSLITEWREWHDLLDRTAAECFDAASTHFEFELILGTRSTRNGLQRRQVFFVKLRSRTPRSTIDAEESLFDWYENVIPAVTRFDEFMSRRLRKELQKSDD